MATNTDIVIITTSYDLSMRALAAATELNAASSVELARGTVSPGEIVVMDDVTYKAVSDRHLEPQPFRNRADRRRDRAIARKKR